MANLSPTSRQIPSTEGIIVVFTTMGLQLKRVSGAVTTRWGESGAVEEPFVYDRMGSNSRTLATACMAISQTDFGGILIRVYRGCGGLIG